MMKLATSNCILISRMVSPRRNPSIGPRWSSISSIVVWVIWAYSTPLARPSETSHAACMAQRVFVGQRLRTYFAQAFFVFSRNADF